MPLYLIERTYAEQLEPNAGVVRRILDVNEQAGVHWLFSFLSADKRKTYCLYEAPDPDAIRDAARKAGLPADAIIEVSQVDPGMYLIAAEGEGRSGSVTGA
jgi:hypothetical protein